MLALDIDARQPFNPAHAEFRWMQRLLAEVLRLALVDASRAVMRAPRGHYSRPGDGDDAMRYVFRDDREWPLSFTNLCRHFELDPGMVRKMIRAHPETILRRAMPTGPVPQ